MRNINKVFLDGRVVRDAEGHGEPGPRYALRVSVAVNDSRKNQNTGQWEDVPSFFDCVIFGNYAAAVAPKLTKGAPVALCGSLRQRRYEAKDGTKRSAVEVVVEQITSYAQKAGAEAAAAFSSGGAYAQDDIPF